MQLFLQCLTCKDDSDCENCCYFAPTQYNEEEGDLVFDETEGEIELF